MFNYRGSVQLLAVPTAVIATLVLVVAARDWTMEISPGVVAAYRGGGQLINYDTFNQDGCTANQIMASNNQYIENTLEAFDNAISSGAEILHFNVRRSADRAFFVFHDYLLDCATDGVGKISSVDSAYLSELDAGYGYTYDGGKSFPWRGLGLAIPRLDQVLERYPNTPLWINLKAESPEDVRALLDQLLDRQSIKNNEIVLFLEDDYADIGRKQKEFRVVSIESSKKCFKEYLAIGWTSYVPASCRDTVVLIPPRFAKYLWGWPDRFSRRMQHAGSDVFLWTKNASLEEAADHRDSGVGYASGDIDSLLK